MKKIIPALAMLLISAVVMSTASYAWFSVNANVTADGMAVKATADTSLMIKTKIADVGGSTVSFNETADNTTNKLWPMQIYTADGTTTYRTADTDTVDPKTGAATKFTDLTARTVDGNTYWVDYIVYLTAAEAVNISALNAKVTFTTSSTDGSTTQAASVAFLGVQTVDANGRVDGAAYAAPAVDTAAVQNVYFGKTASGTALAEVNIKDQITSIPKEGEGAVAVTMRVYIDGSLADPDIAGSTYVRSSAVDLTAVTIKVEFSIVEATPST